MSIEYRTESDSIGEKQIAANAYYGLQTLRAYENFPITRLRMRSEFITVLAEIKKAAALANYESGELDKKIADVIIQACDEIIAGGLRDEFIVDPIQGGAGTSMNMNANEVIANRAIELLGGCKGDYDLVNPNDQVNQSQSTNDVIPTAGKIATIKFLRHLIVALSELNDRLMDKAHEFADIIKVGRTQLQDAVPIRLGQEFAAYAAAVQRDIVRFEEVSRHLLFVNLGGTAIGTGLNASSQYATKVIPHLAELTDLKLVNNEDLIDGTQNLDSFAEVSSTLKICASNLLKLANDLRLMSSGPRAGINEINLPATQNGSSIMPGKVNPVIPEVINQIAFNVIGNDTTITLAVGAGQLELNAFEPIIFYKLFESIGTLTRGIQTFTRNCVAGITANVDRCNDFAEYSTAIATALSPFIGYAAAADLAKESSRTGASIRTMVLERRLMTEEELNQILDLDKMIR